MSQQVRATGVITISPQLVIAHSHLGKDASSLSAVPKVISLAPGGAAAPAECPGSEPLPLWDPPLKPGVPDSL